MLSRDKGIWLPHNTETQQIFTSSLRISCVIWTTYHVHSRINLITCISRNINSRPFMKFTMVRRRNSDSCLRTPKHKAFGYGFSLAHTSSLSQRLHDFILEAVNAQTWDGCIAHSEDVLCKTFPICLMLSTPSAGKSMDLSND